MRQHQLYIGGQWRSGRGRQTPATSPAPGETFASVAAVFPRSPPGSVDR